MIFKHLWLKGTILGFLLICFAKGSLAFAEDRPTENPVQPNQQANSGSSTPSEPSSSKDGWTYNPDAGFIYQKGDFRWTLWGYGERVFNPQRDNYWRRVRQGMEFDLPKFTDNLRPAFVYEVDLTDNYFFTQGPNWKIWENLFVALQNPDDPGQFRALFGENTHVLSREDNLSSGNLPTLNRSLILEEHGSINAFGTQFGIQAQKAISPIYNLSLSAQDNRGSLNTDTPRYVIGNSLAAKLNAAAFNNEKSGQKLSWGVGLDHTRNMGDRTFFLSTATGALPLGGLSASGDKLSFEGDIAYTFLTLSRPTTLEAEGLYSSFSQSHSNVGGAYVMGQISLFDCNHAGELDPYIRYDFVSAGQDSMAKRAYQDAYRVGVNYNLPYTQKLASFHMDVAHNRVTGPSEIVTSNQIFNETRYELRFNVTKYARH